MTPAPTAGADFVRLFTDGACSGNPGPGGWAYILQHPASGKVMDASGAEPGTTNNRMEMMGAIEGLTTLKRPCEVELVTDSVYVGKGLLEWMPKWKANGWRRKEGSGYKVKVKLVKGHAGHAENEACDRMAVNAYKTMVADARQG